MPFKWQITTINLGNVWSLSTALQIPSFKKAAPCLYDGIQARSADVHCKLSYTKQESKPIFTDSATAG